MALETILLRQFADPDRARVQDEAIASATRRTEVGLIAMISAAMAWAGVPCNVVSGYHHDHLFVPKGVELLAMRALAGLGRC